MATVRDLIDRLNYLVDDTVDDKMAINLFNEGQDELSDVAGYAKTGEASFLAGTSTISLPKDWVKLVEIKIKPQGKDTFLRMSAENLVNPHDYYDDEWTKPRTGYEQFGDVIELRPTPKVNGTLQIRYYALLPELKATEDVPVLRGRFHRLLPLFAAARYMENWQDKLPDQQNFLTQFYRGRADLETETMRQHNKYKSGVVYQYRSWK